MKIIITPMEAYQLRKTVKTIRKAGAEIDKATGHDVEHEYSSVIDMFSGSKFATATFGATGITIDIKPEFTKDVLEAYTKYLNACVEPCIALVKAIVKLQEEDIALGKKWLF